MKHATMTVTVRTLAIFALVCLSLLSFALPAFADVIVEPGDDFFRTHKTDCRYNEYRRYIVNTDVGYAYLYVNPETDRTVRSYANGETVSINWIYTAPNGETFGISNPQASNSTTGWFRMADLTVIYDSISFMEAHAWQMSTYEKGSLTIEASPEKPVTMWVYPGKKGTDAFMDFDVATYIEKTYTDESGTEWGYIPYYMGRRHVWVSITDPYAEVIEGAEEQTTPALKAEPAQPADVPPSPGNVRMLMVAGILVGGVVLVTGGVILILLVVQKKARGKTP